jgi:hypothetical protein
MRHNIEKNTVNPKQEPHHFGGAGVTTLFMSGSGSVNSGCNPDVQHKQIFKIAISF